MCGEFRESWCEEKHLEDLGFSSEFYENIDEMIVNEAKKYLKKEMEELKTLRSEAEEKTIKINKLNKEIRKIEWRNKHEYI